MRERMKFTQATVPCRSFAQADRLQCQECYRLDHAEFFDDDDDDVVCSLCGGGLCGPASNLTRSSVVSSGSGADDDEMSAEGESDGDANVAADQSGY